MNRYKVLLLGIGFFGEQWLDVIERSPQCTVAGAAGQRAEFAALERKRNRAFDFPIYEDYIEAIDRTEADLLVCVLPTALHSGAAKRALHKGMHVLCEKPLSFSAEDALDMLAFKSNYAEKLFAIDQNYRWRPYTKTLKRLLDENFLGAVSRVSVSFSRPEMLVGYRGGLEMPFLQDVSIHHFDLLRYFTGGNCLKIYATAYRDPWSIFDGKASTEAILTMDNGIVVNYSGTWSGRGPVTPWDGVFQIMGERGCLTLDEDSRVIFTAHDSKETSVIQNDEMNLTELDHCLDSCVRFMNGGARPETSIEDNINSFLMVCAGEKSVRENRPVELSEYNRMLVSE